MKYTKLEIESFLEGNMDYNYKGEFKLKNVIEIRVKDFKESLKVSKIFKTYMHKNFSNNKSNYYRIYTQNAKKVLKLHKLKLKTLTLHNTTNHIN